MSQLEVSTQIAASPDRVWNLIGDPTRMGEWSPECRELAWLPGSTEPMVGARFSGRNRNGSRRWTTKCTIDSHQASHDISWTVRYLGLDVARWSYRIEAVPEESTCRLVEAFEDRRSPWVAPFLSFARGVRDTDAHNRASMEKTLAQIKTAAERVSV